MPAPGWVGSAIRPWPSWRTGSANSSLCQGNSSQDTLRAALLKEAGTNRSQRVTIRADARATHQAVITAMDILGRLGFGEVNIATVKDEPAGKP